MCKLLSTTMLRKLIWLLALLPVGSMQAIDRWTLNDHQITWNVNQDELHGDHVEMSGQQLSVVMRYGVKPDGRMELSRSLVFPMLRMFPNKTHDNLYHMVNTDIPSLITQSNRWALKERVTKFHFDGMLHTEAYCSDRSKIKLNRHCYPSTDQAFYCEEYELINEDKYPVKLTIPNWHMSSETQESIGVYGAYILEGRLSKHGTFVLKPGEKLEFFAMFSARESKLPPFELADIRAEHAKRRALLDEWRDNLVLETPDEVLNGMFAFAKIRSSESIYRTRGGLMHGPGGENFYAAIWANDQAEYVNPYTPFLGYSVGCEAALNSYRHFARFMNPEFKPIPSSIISEGVDIWNGAGDRGDAAMIAYGASRFALALGDKQVAQELWPLIEWCLEYCHRKLNAGGVVASDSDELEGRFPSGKANLCTSTLYYDALHSAVYLGKELRKPHLKAYQQQAAALKESIETYFGREMKGFHTYQYFEGNKQLRSWICMPLTVGIFTRAEGTINALFSPSLWTKDGLLTQEGSNTYWDRSTLYALRGTLAAGETEKGIDFLKAYSRRRLLGDHVPYAIEAWPEGSQRHLSAESGLYCRIFTEGLFGIRPTGFRQFNLTPRLPDEWNEMRMRHIRAFGGDITIEVSRQDQKISVVVYNGKERVMKRNIKAGDSVTVKL